MNLIYRLRTLPVMRLLALVSILVALLPVSLLGYHLYQSAWQNSWREVQEKHQLLAQNLAMPLQTYVQDHRAMLAMLAESLAPDAIPAPTSALQRALTRTTGFRSLSLIDGQGRTRAYAGPDGIESGSALFSHDVVYLKVQQGEDWALSDMQRHPTAGHPSLFMGQSVRDKQGRQVGVLIGELQVDLIEQVRKQVRFGERGHSAIVDRRGHVIAHPNAQWMAQIRDISDWPIVQEMMRGRTGVTRFYSPFMQGDMVAGYAVVPGIGWGIMVPQPESEVAAQVHQLLRSHVLWGVAGLILAILLALIIARWVTEPINSLASAGRHVIKNGLSGNLPSMSSHAPREVNQLVQVLRSLITGLQVSRDEVSQLNNSLQQRVEIATRQLRDANRQLADAAQSDYLTHLANRRYFEDRLQHALSRRSGDIDHLCVMLIDIDHFKQINDTYGHAAGDAVLAQVARILERGMRSGDLVARYGGDEFVAYMRCSRDIGIQRAREIHAAIEKGVVHWDTRSIHMTASIGLYCQQLRPGLTINTILNQADNAMYRAKRQGRNRVVDISL